MVDLSERYVFAQIIYPHIIGVEGAGRHHDAAICR